MTEGAPRVRFRVADPELLPARHDVDDAGVDLRARVNVRLAPGERALVGTAVHVAIPPGWCGWVTPRSGLAKDLGLSIVNAPGLVDAGYRGEVGVVLVNLGQEPVTLRRGDRIAQLTVCPVLTSAWEQVDALDDTTRGERGFGSSGRG